MAPLKRALDERIAEQLAIGKSQFDAVRIACEALGKKPMSAPNARRHCQRARGLLHRAAELRAIMNAKDIDGLQGTRDFILRRCHAIAFPELGELRVSDQVQAMHLMAKITGQLAPEKHELTGKDGGPLEVSDKDRVRALSVLLARVKAKNASGSPT